MVPRPTPPRYHVDKDKTPIPGSYSDRGEGFGGNPVRKPHSLPPAAKLGPLMLNAELSAGRHAEASRTRTYSAEEIEALVKRESCARGQSAKMAAARELDAHKAVDQEMRAADKRTTALQIGLAAAIISGVVAVGTAIGTLVVRHFGGIDEMQATASRIETSALRTEKRLTAIEHRQEEIADQGIKGRTELRAQIDAIRNPPKGPDFGIAVRRQLAQQDH